LQKDRNDRPGGDTGESLDLPARSRFGEGRAATYKHEALRFRYVCWTSLLVNSTVTHPIPRKPVFQGVGSVPAGAA